MNLRIRPEIADDAVAVHALVARAFESAPFSAPPVGGETVPGEATLVGWLRDSPAYDPRFALTAHDGPELVGHLMATWGTSGQVPVLGVGPVSVAPHRQGEGIGSRLMTELIARAENAGETVLVLLGDPDYYSRFGFVPASHLGITGDPEWGDYFQALALGVAPSQDGGSHPVPRGEYRYAEPFSRLG